MHSLNTRSSIFVIDDGILISDKDEHPSKALFPIEVTEEGITICFNDEHSKKAFFQIEVTDVGITICLIFDDENSFSDISFSFNNK